ncbi:MAG: DNA-deoxyinosine glycosylase [Gammaproteobacteria bacterium]
MSLVHSFEPIIGSEPRIIILGSMPGVVSLRALQYYANPRNAFWPIMADLFEIDIDCDYRLRVQQVAELPLILWDTLKACHRPGSLDSNIQKQAIEANDIGGLIRRYAEIRAIAFNGAASEKYFRQLAIEHLPGDRSIELIKMPSTSPANASWIYERKLKAWRSLLKFL